MRTSQAVALAGGGGAGVLFSENDWYIGSNKRGGFFEMKFKIGYPKSAFLVGFKPFFSGPSVKIEADF